MAEISWTNEQLSAIKENGTDLLVSAAAGSGKTAVLTERIIRKLTDTKNPVDVTDFLIVTFTVSATTELREKLSSAIRKAYRENPSLKCLKRQILNLPSAKILTIDSFCKFVGSECAKDLGLPVDFQLGDENELDRIKAEVLSETLDSCFNGENIDLLYDTSFLPEYLQSNFLDLVQAFSQQKSFDSLNTTLIDIYSKLIKYPEPILRAVAYLDEYCSILRAHYFDKAPISFFETKIGIQILGEIKETAAAALKYFEEAEKAIFGYDEMCEKYSPAIQDDIAAATRILSAEPIEMPEIIRSHSHKTLGRYTLRNENEAGPQNKFKDLREEGKELLSKLKKKYPITDENEIFSHIAKTFTIANILFSVIAEFDKRLMKEKTERKLFSFDDVAQFAYKALIKEGSYNKETREFERTDYALQLGEKFREILIDEYQDVNELQDTIFRAVSNSHNRFMVGDLKQSIYKFRGATPEIFFDYRNTFSPVESTDGTPRLISLQNNFRSDNSVIDFVNCLFDVIMNYQSEDVYRKDDFLKFSKNSDMKIPTEIAIFKNDSEFEYVADRIMSAVNSESFTFGDICILSRNHDHLKEIQKVLSDRHIPSDYTPSDNFFSSFEIETLHSLLKATDNPSDDIAILSLASSPIFAFTPDELLTVRESARGCDFYFALRDYNGDDKHLADKCRRITDSLKLWRKKSRTVQSHTLIWWLLDQTNFPSLIQKLNRPEERLKNIMTFYSVAAKYEEQEFKGITKFLTYLESLIKSNSRLSKKEHSDNAVHLMTIHDSKGLEFPMCFYISSGSKINRKDEQKKVVMSEVFGPTFTIPTGNIGGKVSTYAEKAAIAETRAATVDEELRLLYVALTRAKNSLIITGKHDIAGLKKYLELAVICKTAFTYNIKNALSMLKIIGIGLYTHPTFKEAVDSFDGENLTLEGKGLTVKLFEEYNSERLENKAMLTASRSRASYLTRDEIEFAMKGAGNQTVIDTPYKISVSNIREGLLDEGADDSQSRVKKYPDFTALESENISSFTGTAMHVFMQFCDFASCVENGTVNEAERLFKNGFITEEQKNVLNHTTLTDFFKSKTYKCIAQSERVEREKRYTLLLPSSSFYSDEKRKEELDSLQKRTLIQGVIDCYYMNSDGTITLIDFKTDSVSKKGGVQILRQRHSHQLELYRRAIEEIEGKAVSRALIYSFCLSKEIEI